jgi:hypothetical protein
MKKYNEQSVTSLSRYKAPLLIALLACALSSCNKAPDRPTPPQAPPKPQTAAKIPLPTGQKAVFTYSSKPAFHYQDAQGTKLKRRVLRT